MPITWRTSGREMATVDLRQFENDQIVIHFGGALTSIDAYTFANSLVAFADTVRSVNGVVNPGQGIEVRVEALGDGSFRAVIKKLAKRLPGFLSDGAVRIFWGLIAALIFDRLIRSDPSSRITINTNEVIIETGRDRVIVPRAIYDQAQHVRIDPEVQRNLSRTFQTIEADEAITNFGLTPRINDPEPILQIPRDVFFRLTTLEIIDGDSKRRERLERGKLVILKAWLTTGSRKWSFEWNGVPISAPIKDAQFLRGLEAREILIGHGDAIDAEIKYQQIYDDTLGTWVNDTHTFEVVRVISHIPKAHQPRLVE
jgi:hypothetical protein